MKKIKIQINYRQLKQLIAMTEQYIAGILADNPMPTEQDKISLDILMGVRQDMRKKAVTKEMLQYTNEKFKIALRYFEAYYLKLAINSPDLFDAYVELDKALSGNKYLIENQIEVL